MTTSQKDSPPRGSTWGRRTRCARRIPGLHRPASGLENHVDDSRRQRAQQSDEQHDGDTVEMPHGKGHQSDTTGLRTLSLTVRPREGLCRATTIAITHAQEMRCRRTQHADEQLWARAKEMRRRWAYQAKLEREAYTEGLRCQKAQQGHEQREVHAEGKRGQWTHQNHELCDAYTESVRCNRVQ